MGYLIFRRTSGLSLLVSTEPSARSMKTDAAGIEIVRRLPSLNQLKFNKSTGCRRPSHAKWPVVSRGRVPGKFRSSSPRVAYSRHAPRFVAENFIFHRAKPPRSSSFPSSLLPCNDRRKISKSGSRKHKWKVKRATESHHPALASSSIVHPSTVRVLVFYDAKLHQHTR